VSAKPKLDAPDAEARAAFQSADVVVATPRAALDLFNGERLRLDRLRAIVVDEADELLAPGCVDTPPIRPHTACLLCSRKAHRTFLHTHSHIHRFAEDVRALITAAAGGDGTGPYGQAVQVVFAAATMGRAEWDGRIRGAFRGPLERIASPGLHRAAPGVTQRVVPITGEEARMAALLEALGAEGDESTATAPGLPALIFTSSTQEADSLAARLIEAGLPVAAFHGRVSGARGELLDELQAGLLAALVVTDVAARGLDLPQVRHVVNWRPAPSAALHLHRVGRTGRAGAPGACAATTLFDADDAEDAAAPTAPMLAAAAAGGWEALGELLDTRRAATE
jgi:superfamily II DNA/RNA helicase